MDNLKEKSEYAWKAYEYLLNELTVYLNLIHKVNYSNRFWSIIIGNWLFRFVAIYYVKYLRVKKDKKSFHLCYEKESWYTSNSIEDFNENYCTKYFNEMIYDQIFLSLYPKNGLEYMKYKDWNKVKRVNLFKRVLFNITRRLNFGSTCIWFSYLKPNNELLGILKSKLGMFPIFYSDNIKIYDKKDRKKYYFEMIDANQDEFIKIFCKNLEYNLPIIYLEGFKDFMEDSLRKVKRKPKNLVIAIGFYCNERLKFLAAYWMEKYKTRIIGIQHGGSYGITKVHSYEKWEKSVCNKWIKYGEDNE